MSTTVSSIDMSIKGIRDTAANLAKLLAAMQADPKLTETLVAATGEKLIDYNVNGAVNHLNTYADMMQKVRDNTEVDWPPV